ncbi:MAG: aminoglycoside 6-adenylyltransferase [Acidimicrobiia bacterium]|nr:aminoglycoside 6-adenylyltransferase [Acidimicrobiia bacterium]
MTDTPLLDRVLAWAAEDPNIVAVVLTGSRAALRRTPDRWSDVDIELICDDPAPLVEDDAWFHAFGEVLVYLRLLSEEGTHPTRLAAYSEGEVDFSLCGRDRIHSQASGLCDLYRRGYRVLIDKEGLTEALPEPDGRPISKQLPTEEEFRGAVSVFWFEAYHQAGYLAREDLWALKFRDGTMKKYLRKMLEWAAVTRDPDADVRQIGHGMRNWVDDQTWVDLHSVWGGFDADSSRRALMATIDVFRMVAREVGAALGFDYPESSDRQITERLTGSS